MNEAPDFAIETSRLAHRYGGRWAVRGLELKVPRGCVYGFLGLNGAGKSTTIRMLMGVLSPHGGTARVLGFDPASQPIEVKRRAGYVAEKANFYDWMTVRELTQFVAHYRKNEWDDAHAAHLAQVFKLPLDQKIRTLSKGQHAKVALLLAMAFQPELLVLDEPTGGLDPVVRREFLEGLLAEFMESGRTVFISSHLINEIAGLVDHVGIIADGALIRQQPAEQLQREVKRVRLTFDSEPPPAPAFEHLVRERRTGRELLLTLDRFEAERSLGPLQALEPAQLVVEDLSLEDIFVELNHGGEDGT